MQSNSGDELAELRLAVRKNPRDVRALSALAARLRAAGEMREAETFARRALVLAPADHEALMVLGGLLQLEGRFADAIEIADAAIRFDPASSGGWQTRGDSLLNSGAPAEAADAYRRAAADPVTAFEVQLRLARALQASGETSAALAAYDAAQAIDPASPLPPYQRSLLHLGLRDFQTGWAGYEQRWRTDRFLVASRGLVPMGMVPHLVLSPTPETLAGRRVLLVGEQGIGDQIMFASIIPDLAASAGALVCVCEPRLMGLLAPAFPGVSFVHPDGASVEADVLLAMGSLGHAFRSSEADFPGTPYLKAEPSDRGKWAAKLGARSTRPRIGISWRGGTAATRQVARSLDLASFVDLLDLPDCELVSLQYGDVADEIEAVNRGRDHPIRYFPAQDISAFTDLAGLIDNLDAVVSVQTSVVHLSGAMGKPCFVLLPTDPEWRYQLRGETMPWYGSVRLLRQQTAGDWRDVLAMAGAAVRALEHPPA